MKRWQLLIALVALFVVLCVGPSVRASTIVMSVDGQNRNVPVHYVPDTVGQRGHWVVGDPANPEFHWETPEFAVELKGALDPDPSITFAVTAVDFGAPSAFGFTFITPLIPVFPNPSVVFDSLSGSVTNGLSPGGVTVTALAPPAGIPVDGDGVAELQVYTLSDDGGVTWKNVGLDAGPTTIIPLGVLASGTYGSYNQGPIPTIAGGPWTHMRVDLNFGLSGGGDTFTLNGAKVLVPEPSTLVLVGLLSLGAFCHSRRQRP